MSREIKVLHLESTDICQAACPLCSREINPKFKNPHNQLTVDQITKHFDEQFISNLDKMFICGNYGDPAAGKHTLEIYKYFRYINPTIVLGMNTNGAIQNTQWWMSLAEIFVGESDYVVFSIDGLADTNHIYRRGVIWDKLMDNCKQFIESGGNAQWDMLVYKHNQHQVDECEQLARELGFSWFRAKVSKRDHLSGLEPPTGWIDPIVKSGPINCMAVKESSVYLDARGIVHPCCWLGNSLDNILSLSDVTATWNTENTNPTCKKICSGLENSFTNQWQRETNLETIKG